jgi:hypothetical protein
MGGFGSGGWRKRRRTVDTCPLLDINYLAARGCLQPGCSSTCQWLPGTEINSISLYAETSRLYLSYALRRGPGEWEEVAETIPLDQRCRPAHFGFAVGTGVATRPRPIAVITLVEEINLRAWNGAPTLALSRR